MNRLLSPAISLHQQQPTLTFVHTLSSSSLSLNLLLPLRCSAVFYRSCSHPQFLLVPISQATTVGYHHRQQEQQSQPPLLLREAISKSLSALHVANSAFAQFRSRLMKRWTAYSLCSARSLIRGPFSPNQICRISSSSSNDANY